MKSMPMTMRGPVDDDNFSWVKSQPRLYESQGDIGFRSLAHSSPKNSSRQRSLTTGSVGLMPSNYNSAPILPKIATGRSAHSAKKLYKDYETIKIRSRIQRDLENPKMPPLYVPKNPKPLYKHPVDEMKHFNILHLREFAEQGELEPDTITNDSREFYARITFLRNAVRNTDGTTSYQNLCKRPRSWSEPTQVNSEPGLIKGNRLHWSSASASVQHPRMLLPLKPGPHTKWYAWNVDQPRKKEKKSHRRKDPDHLQREFVQVFSPHFDPHPTPAAGLKHHSQHAAFHSDRGIQPGPYDPQGVTFITEDKDENEKDVEGGKNDEIDGRNGEVNKIAGNKNVVVNVVKETSHHGIEVDSEQNDHVRKIGSKHEQNIPSVEDEAQLFSEEPKPSSPGGPAEAGTKKHSDIIENDIGDTIQDSNEKSEERNTQEQGDENVSENHENHARAENSAQAERTEGIAELIVNIDAKKIIGESLSAGDNMNQCSEKKEDEETEQEQHKDGDAEDNTQTDNAVPVQNQTDNAENVDQDSHTK